MWTNYFTDKIQSNLTISHPCNQWSNLNEKIPQLVQLYDGIPAATSHTLPVRPKRWENKLVEARDLVSCSAPQLLISWNKSKLAPDFKTIWNCKKSARILFAWKFMNDWSDLALPPIFESLWQSTLPRCLAWSLEDGRCHDSRHTRISWIFCIHINSRRQHSLQTAEKQTCELSDGLRQVALA
jgi:hypothetical protein